MWGTFVTWWTGNPVVRWITYIALALIGWEVVKRHLKEAGRDAERKAIAIKQAEEARRVEAMRRTINQENENAAQRADEAVRNLPQYRHTDELRNADEALAAIVLGNSQGRGGGAEGH